MPINSGTIFGSTSYVRPQLDGQGYRAYGSSSGYVGLLPAADAGSIDFVLPSADGSNGDVMTTDGSGNLSFTTPSAGVTDHGALTGLSDDDHSQYALLAGRSGGQVLYGGTGIGDDIWLMSTTNATKGYVIIGTAAYFTTDTFRIQGSTSGYVGFKSPATTTNNINYTLPGDDGSANKPLKTDGSQTLFWGSHGLEIGSTKTTSFTAATGYLYPITLTSVTVDISVGFPSSPSTGDKFGFFITAAHSSGGTSATFADRPFTCAEPAAVSINGSTYSPKSGDGGNEYSLWLAGECLIFQYTGSTWLLVEDRRIPHICNVYNTTAFGTTSGTPANVTYGAESSDNANLHSTTSNTERIYYKRGNTTYDYIANFRWTDNSTDRRDTAIQDSAFGALASDGRLAKANSQSSLSAQYVPTAGNYSYTRVYQSSGSSLDLTTSGTVFVVAERLS